MSDNQQNKKLDEARQVVKKQLLKKLMQEAVDEIGASDDAALEQLVGSIKSGIDFSRIQGKIKPLLKGELEKDLMRGLSEVEDKLSGQLKGILSRRALDKASESIDPEFLSRVSDRVLEDHHGRISEQIESDLAVRIDRTAHGAIRTLLGEKREELQERVLGSIKEETLDEIRSTVEGSIAETISGRIQAEGIERIEKELRDSIRSSLIDRTVEGLRDSIDDDMLNGMIENAVDPHRQSLVARVRQELEARVRQEAGEAADDFANGDAADLEQLASGLLSEDARRSVREKIKTSLANSVTGSIRADGFDELEASVREKITDELSKRAVEHAREVTDDDLVETAAGQAVDGIRNKISDRIQSKMDSEIQNRAGEALAAFMERDEDDLKSLFESALDEEFLASTGRRALTSFSEEINGAVRKSVSTELDGKTRRAVRELLSLDGEEFRSRISGSLDEAELDAVMDRVKATVTNGLAQRIQEDDLGEIQKSLNDEVSMLLSRRTIEHIRQTVDDDYLASMGEQAFAEFGEAIGAAVRNRIDEELDTRTRGAVRELLSADGEEFSSRVSGSMDEAELVAVTERIKDSVTDGLARQISEKGLAELQQRVNDDVRELIGRHAVDHAHETIGEEYLHEVSRRALGHYSDRVEERVRAGLDSGVAKEARKVVDTFLESGDHDVLDRITDVMDASEIEGMRERLVRLLSESMADAVREEGIEEIQKSVNRRLSSKVEEDALSFLRSSVDEKTLAQLSEKVVGEFRGDVADQMRRKLDEIATEESRQAVEDGSFAEDVSSAVRSDDDLLERVLGRVREMIVELVASVSISRLDDVESVAQAARDHVSFDNDTLIAATAMLRTKIMQDIARRTTKSLGNTDDVTEDAREWVNEEDPHIEEAAAHVQRLALDTVRALAGKKISDTAQMAARIAPEFDADSIPVQEAVEETRALILDRIEKLAAERIAHTDETALEASSRIEDDHESIQKAVSAAVSMLMDDVVRLSEWRLSWTEKVAAEARGRMDDEPADVAKAAAELEQLLVGEVAEATMNRVADTDKTADAAGHLIDRDHEVLRRAIDALRGELVGDIARGAVESLSDSEDVADEARSSIDPTHAHITSAVQQLRRRLMGEIADGAVSGLEDTDETANESRQLIGQEPEAVKRSKDRLRDMLLKEIGRSVLDRFAHADEAAAEALGRIDSDEDALVRARAVLRRRLVEQLLADALSNLGDEVSSDTDDSERAFFRTALRQVMGRNSSTESSEDESDEEGDVPVRFRDRGPTPPKPPVIRPSHQKKANTVGSEGGSKGAGGSGAKASVSGEPAFRIQESNDLNGPSDGTARNAAGPMITEPGWTILSEMQESDEANSNDDAVSPGEPTMSVSGEDRSWSVTEYTSAEGGSSMGDGVVGNADEDPDFSIFGAPTEEYTYRMTVNCDLLRDGIREKDGDLTDILGEFHPAGRADGDSIEASAEALLDHAMNVLMLRLRTAGRPGTTENPGLGPDWLSNDEIVVTSGTMFVAVEMEEAFRNAARTAADEFNSFGITVEVNSGGDN